MNPRWRVLVLGCGWIAWQVHLPYLARLHQAGRLACLHVADVDGARAAEAAAAFGADVHPPEVAEGAFDVVVVATVPTSHAALSIDALAAGAHVIVEKPLALTAADAAAIVAASARYGRGVYPLYTVRHRPEVALIRTALTYDVGPVREVHGAWPRREGLPATAGGLEAGVLWDLGSHLADAGLYLADWPVTAGIADGRRTHPAVGERPGDGRARWQTTAGPMPVDAPAWRGIEADVTFTGPSHGAGPRRLRVEASWSAPVTADTSRIELVGEGGRLVWRTVFGWSPDRATVPEPAVWIAGAAGTASRVLLAAQPRDPRVEYTAQWDAAFAALVGYEMDSSRCTAALSSACASTTVLHAVQTSLDSPAPHQFAVAGPIKEDQ